MTNIVTNIHEPLLSPARLKTYRSVVKTDDEALALYLWNMALGEALFPLLHAVEVLLRNRIDSSFSEKEPLWLELTCTSPWKGWDAYRYKPHGNKEVIGNPERDALQRKWNEWGNRNQIVADLSLSFWTGLFKRHYKNHIWSRKGVLYTAFPHLPHPFEKDPVSALGLRLTRMRHLRNRVCHHEPIFNWPGSQKGSPHTTLRDAYLDCLDLLRWMSAEMSQLHGKIDRFETVYKAGWRAYM